jgi:hypothetical protein
LSSPSNASLSYLPPTVNKALTTSSLSRALIHQCLGHGSDRKLDLMCHLQTLHGHPKRPFPISTTICPICVKAKFTHPPKGKTLDTSHLSREEYLHMDFSFWSTPSIRHFTRMLVIIDAHTRMLWLFCTSSKRPPMHIIFYFFDILIKEKCCIKTIRIDEEGSLARNAEFTSYLLHHRITLDTTGGYSSFLNGKVERPHQTIAQLVRAMLINSGHSPDTWCYCAETAADIYRYTYHSTIQTSPYHAWYNIKPSISHLRVWGCVVYVKTPSPKKSEDRVTRGYFMGFTKSRYLVRWLDPSTRQVKHAYTVQFDEHCTPTSIDDHIAPGSFLLSNTPPSTVHLPEVCIDINDNPSFASPIFSIQLSLPPKGQQLGCTIMTCTCYNLPYIHHLAKGSPLAAHLAPHGPHNATFWLLSINHQEFSTAEQAAHYLSSLQLSTGSTSIFIILARRQATDRTSLADTQAIFNQIRLSYRPTPDPASPPIIAPIGC